MRYVRNSYGIPIKKCCASCVHKHINPQGAIIERLCDAGRGVIESSGYCEGWHMQPFLDNAGKGDGQVKKKEYVEYITACRLNESEGKISPMPAGTLRKAWEGSEGSCYDDDFKKVI